MAIDVNKIIKYVLYGQGEQITGPFVKQTDYYNHHIQEVPYDPEGALKLLKEALSEAWEELPLIFESSAVKGTGREEIMRFINDTNKKLG